MQETNKQNFCSLPFIAVEKRHDQYAPCCLYTNSSWPTFQNIEHYWKSQDLYQLQQNHVNGIRDPGCDYCWHQEDQGFVSMRQAVNISRLSSIDISRPKIKHVKLLTGKTCNLACMMCFPSVSSTYQQLWENDKAWKIPVIKSKERVYETDIDQYIRKNASEIEYIEALGGEPLFEKDYLSLLEHLVTAGQSQHITTFTITNGTIFTERMIKLFSQFQKAIFSISVDGVGLVNDYQRWPSKWQVIEKNIDTMKDNFDISVLPTVTAVNILRLPEVYEYFQRKNIIINNFEVVRNWPMLLPVNLPDPLKNVIDTKFRGLVEGPGDPRSLIDFIKKWDKKRSITIVDYMPEWADYLSA
jgi:molybdenum cofactor biosynthesis enzyme MoaA